MSLERPNWYNYQDRELYNKLLGVPSDKLSEQERRFIISMYRAEEYANGLDGLDYEED